MNARRLVKPCRAGLIPVYLPNLRRWSNWIRHGFSRSGDRGSNPLRRATFLGCDGRTQAAGAIQRDHYARLVKL